MLNAWRALLYAHARATQRVDAALSAAGLPPLTWYDVLWALRRAPRRRLRTGALAEEVTLSRTGLTRLIDRIERAGLLRREPVPEDRRFLRRHHPGGNSDAPKDVAYLRAGA
jgi:DNA-binding MarR family transcriptional regulator